MDLQFVNSLLHFLICSYPDEENLEEKDVRPRARHKRDWEDVSKNVVLDIEKLIVMAAYN